MRGRFLQSGASMAPSAVPGGQCVHCWALCPSSHPTSPLSACRHLFSVSDSLSARLSLLLSLFLACSSLPPSPWPLSRPLCLRFSLCPSALCTPLGLSLSIPLAALVALSQPQRRPEPPGSPPQQGRPQPGHPGRADHEGRLWGAGAGPTGDLHTLRCPHTAQGLGGSASPKGCWGHGRKWAKSLLRGQKLTGFLPSSSPTLSAGLLRWHIPVASVASRCASPFWHVSLQMDRYI